MSDVIIKAKNDGKINWEIINTDIGASTMPSQDFKSCFNLDAMLTFSFV